MVSVINEHKDLLDEYKYYFTKLFEQLNVSIDFSIELYIQNLITNRKFIVSKSENKMCDFDEITIQEKVDSLSNDKQKAYVSDILFKEMLDKFDVIILLIINDLPAYDISLLNLAIENSFKRFRKYEGSVKLSISDAANAKMHNIMRALSLSNPLTDHLNAISTLKYETAEISCDLLLTNEPQVFLPELSIMFERTVPIEQYKTVRKLCEATGSDSYLLGNGMEFYGYILKERVTASPNINPDVTDPIKQSLAYRFKINLKGVLDWEIYDVTFFIDKPLPIIASKMMVFSYPSHRITYEELAREVNHKFSGESESSPDALWDIVRIAVDQKHGTMIIISEGAADEADRLRKCAIKLKKVLLKGKSLVSSVTSIDGAVLCDPFGHCYAIGVILDGAHSPESNEDISRGARYNSAQRYSYATQYKHLIIIVSEDGDITLV